MDFECPSHNRIRSWLNSAHTSYLPITPPPDTERKSYLRPLKRKRAASLPMYAPSSSSHRNESPKRQRTRDIDIVEPGQSVSQVGSENALALNRTNTFCPPASRVSSSSPNRSSSPARETPVILRSAWPPVWTESLNGLHEAPPPHAEELGERLADGVDFHFIPHALQSLIKNDPEIGYQTTRPADFNRNDTRTAEELSTMWKKIKEIFLNARDCKNGGRDENAWCDDVVRPLVHLAMELYGNDRWWFQSVQSQSINPRYLSTIPTPTVTDPARRKPIDRKTDYVFSYSHHDPDISALYKRLDVANRREIGHTLDTFTKRTALFSGLEIKPMSGDHTEAELQMSIWIAASLRKKQELAQLAQEPFEPTEMIEPALTVVGHEHSVYYAYPRDGLLSGWGGTHILGPIDRFDRLSTDSVRGIFRLVRLYGNILEYGMDQGERGYWGRFFGKVLEKLAHSSEKGEG